jgi:ribosomal protein L32
MQKSKIGLHGRKISKGESKKMTKRKTKAKPTVEIAKNPCKQCGKPTASNKICHMCGRIICNNCAQFNEKNRYCPTCFEKIKALYKLA